MVVRCLQTLRIRGWHLHIASLSAVGLGISLWIRAKTVGEDERGNAERRALFVGFWPTLLWAIGDSLEAAERPKRRLSPIPRSNR
jgi:hypothetical protein